MNTADNTGCRCVLASSCMGYIIWKVRKFVIIHSLWEGGWARTRFDLYICAKSQAIFIFIVKLTRIYRHDLLSGCNWNNSDSEYSRKSIEQPHAQCKIRFRRTIRRCSEAQTWAAARMYTHKEGNKSTIITAQLESLESMFSVESKTTGEQRRMIGVMITSW